jgi:hypothetical protein
MLWPIEGDDKLHPIEVMQAPFPVCQIKLLKAPIHDRFELSLANHWIWFSSAPMLAMLAIYDFLVHLLAMVAWIT